MTAFVPLLHVSLAVDGLDRAIAFFERALGFATDFRDDDLTDEVARLTRRPGLTVKIAQLSRPADGFQLELIEFHDGDDVPASGDGPVPLGHICFATADLDDAIGLMVDAGAETLGEIVDFEEGRCVYLKVPGGAVIEFEEVIAAPGTTAPDPRQDL